MKKRSYKKYTEVYVKLEERCQKACESGMSKILPGERELAAELNTSRMTLRKALEKAEMNGLIQRKNKLTEIISQKGNLNNCGKILFISSGYRTEFNLGAFQRLWFGLKAQLDSLGAEMELFLTNPSTPKEEIISKCQSADIILLTVIEYDTPKIDVDFLVKMKFEKTIVALSDPYLDYFDNYIALDNYAVGELAARALKFAGCNHMSFISSGFNNLMFHKRFYGFCDTLKRFGIEIPDNFPEKHCKHFQEIGRRQILSAWDNGCDGAFVASDEGIEFITHDLFQKNLIPEKFKLVTLNGKGEALLCNPPVTCVNHATDNVVRCLVGYLKNIGRNPNQASIKRLITPELYLNGTIGKVNTNLMEEILC